MGKVGGVSESLTTCDASGLTCTGTCLAKHDGFSGDIVRLYRLRVNVRNNGEHPTGRMTRCVWRSRRKVVSNITAGEFGVYLSDRVFVSWLYLAKYTARTCARYNVFIVQHLPTVLYENVRPPIREYFRYSCANCVDRQFRRLKRVEKYYFQTKRY